MCRNIKIHTLNSTLNSHTPPEPLLRKIKCSRRAANAEGLQIQVETWATTFLVGGSLRKTVFFIL